MWGFSRGGSVLGGTCNNGIDILSIFGLPITTPMLIQTLSPNPLFLQYLQRKMVARSASSRV